MYKNPKWIYYFQYLVLFGLLYCVFFIKLGNFQIRWWDESVFAVNSYEMWQNGKYFSLYYDKFPDFFNLKPPLTFWIQIIFIKILGYSEFSLRLPSALAAAISVIVVFRFVSRYFNHLWAWISALILITASGFVGFHTSRTADSDSLLTLFLLCANIFFLKYIITQKTKNIVFFFIFLTLSFSTKSFAALFFSPAYLIILIQKRVLKKFIVNPRFIISLFVFIGAAFTLIVLREKDTPGYVNMLIFSDVSRFSNIIWNEHKQEALFYLYNLFETRFALWSVFFVMGSVMIFFKDKSSQKDILVVFLIFIAVYFVVITLSLTKLYWYDMPLFPYLSVVAAYPIFLLIEKINFNENYPASVIKYFIVALCFLYPYVLVFNKSQANTIPVAEKFLEANEIYIHNKIKKGESLDGIKVYYAGWNGGLLFYKYMLAKKNESIQLINEIEQIMAYEKVLVCNDSLKKVLSHTFNVNLLESTLNANLYITSPKN